MAAKHFYRKGFLLLLFNFISTAALEKRFSDFKRCADEECSMLLCRGKATNDFSGPDCRFLSFKKSETVYVYYKLSGKRTDMWAGSVGSSFGYFPKDLLAINHVYTDKEHEVPAEETDFVCFDTGFDRFDNYDIDLLLGSPAAKYVNERKGTSDQIQVADGADKDTKLSEEAAAAEEEEEEEEEEEDDLATVPDDQSASLPQPGVANEVPSIKEVQRDTATLRDATERAPEDIVNDQRIPVNSVLETGDLSTSETKDAVSKDAVQSLHRDGFVSENEPVSISEGVQIPELKTTLGNTFDAVTTDVDTTTKVTPYEEEESEKLEHHPEDYDDVKTETPLLPFSQETAGTPAFVSLRGQDIPPTTLDDDPKTAEEEANTWRSLGDKVFSVVTGGERTERDFGSEEDDDDDDEEEEEEAYSETPVSVEETNEDKEPPKTEFLIEPMDLDPVPKDPTDSIHAHAKAISDSEKLLFDPDSKGDVVEMQPGERQDETLKPIDDLEHQMEPSTVLFDPVPQDYPQQSDGTTDEPREDMEEEKRGEVTIDSEVIVDKANTQNSSIAMEREDSKGALDENKTAVDQETIVTETHQYLSTEEGPPEDSYIRDDNEMAADDIPRDPYHDHLIADTEANHSQPELSVEEPQIHGESLREEMEDEETHDEKELLEDENALSSSQSDNTDAGTHSPETSLPIVSTPEPEYSDSVMRLTLLRTHYTEESMARFQKFLGLKNLFKVEALFSDLDSELGAVRLSQSESMQDVENALESVREASETIIMDQIEKMLDERDKKHDDEHQMDTNVLDAETEILDEFQELAFILHQKYSTASDSTPLAAEKPSDHFIADNHELMVKNDLPQTVQEEKFDVPKMVSDDNITELDLQQRPAEIEEEQIVVNEVHTRPDVSVEEDGGHFNNNKDNQLNFGASDEIQKVPQATLDNRLDMGLGIEVENSPSESLDNIEPTSEFDEGEVGLFSTGIAYTGCIISMMQSKVAEWTIVMISLLPDEWKPGETLFGCPWQAVIITALVGVVTFTLFLWRTVLSVKKREYLVDERRLKDQIRALKKEKNYALGRMSELEKETEQLKEDQKQSEEEVSCTMKRVQDLENKILEAETQNEQIAEDKSTYEKLLQEERENSKQNETRIQKLEKSNEKLQLSRKKIQEALSKTSVLLDEAKIREDARNVQRKCLEKDYTALKEDNKSLKATLKTWEDKHQKLSEQIKVYQKSQKELEDSVVLKDHNVEVLSELLADLDACDLQKGEVKVLANGEVTPDKKTAIKNRIKQMMDVSRVQTTLSVIEEERDRFMTKLLNEEKTRKALEEQHQELEHSIATLKSEKSHVENQFKILQQKNEIMVEMYQQKENALQQRLTKEELERRSKENLLSEVGGKAVEAEEQVKVLRQRINEMEEQMKKTEEVYKEQIKEQENKTHSNWVNARNAERALNQEKLESSKLREKLAVLTSQLNERRAPLFRPNSGQPAGLRQGDSYGPSPVSGGAPSPPLMIEGPRRPPSAPVGRRIDPYGPRPPSDPHGRYPDNKHTSGMDMSGPRSSSPANLDGSTQAVDPQIKAESKAEASTENPEPGPGSFLASPIRDSPGPMMQGPPPGPGLHDPHLPPGPHGRLPPGGPYRPPRPGLYHPPPGPHGPPPPNVPLPPHGPPLPANGHPGMPLPGPMGGEFGPRPTNGHSFHPRPGHAINPRGPPPPHFRPPPPHHLGLMPQPHGLRGHMGPRPPVPPDMRYLGPRDHTGPPLDLPPGIPAHPARGDGYGQTPPDALQNSAGALTGPGPDLPLKQEASQDAATVKP